MISFRIQGLLKSEVCTFPLNFFGDLLWTVLALSDLFTQIPQLGILCGQFDADYCTSTLCEVLKDGFRAQVLGNARHYNRSVIE